MDIRILGYKSAFSYLFMVSLICSGAIVSPQTAAAQSLNAKINCEGEWLGTTGGTIALTPSHDMPGYLEGSADIGRLPITGAIVRGSFFVRPLSRNLLDIYYAAVSARIPEPEFMHSSASLRNITIGKGVPLVLGAASSQIGLYPDNEDMTCVVKFSE